jgi:universal stress protein A
MSYKHVLAAIDLSKSSDVVINNAISIAKNSDALLSLIYVDLIYADYYMALPNAGWSYSMIEDDRRDELTADLQRLAEDADYPIANVLIEMGDLNHNINMKVKELGADLLVCGHHHDFWSRQLSSVKQIFN